MALRLRRICSTDDEYKQKAAEYTNYLTQRGYNANKVGKSFSNVLSISRTEARKKVTKENKSLVVFTTKYNPRGPNVKAIINQHLHIIENQPELANIFPTGTVIVANKKEPNLGDLLLRSDPNNIKQDLTNSNELGYTKCDKNCDSCKNYVDETTSIKSFATGRTFIIRRESTCTSKNVIYVAYCKTCGKQGVRSTISWKARLANYKCHIKKKVPSCKIVKHFIEECPDENLSNIGFIIVDAINNTDRLTKLEIDALLLAKEKFWIGTLVTQHQGLNGTHDWGRKKRTEREKPSR